MRFFSDSFVVFFSTILYLAVLYSTQNSSVPSMLQSFELFQPTVSLLHNLHHEIKLFYINLFSIVLIHYTFSSLHPADDCHAYGKYFIFCISMAFMPLSLGCGFEVRIKILLKLMYFIGVKFTPKKLLQA